MFTLSLVIRDSANGTSREMDSIVILKSLDHAARVAVLAEALAKLFESLDPAREPHE